MHIVRLDAVASLLNIAGAVVLGVDALRAPRRALRGSGVALWNAVRASRGAAEHSNGELQAADVTFWLGLLGLVVLGLGFLLDLYTKVWNNCVLFTFS